VVDLVLKIIIHKEMAQIFWLVVLIVTIVMMIKAKSKIVEGQQLADSLSGGEKIIIWILCLLNPILSGAIFYYGWKKKLPVKAKQANTISLWAALLELILGVSIFFLSNPK